MTLDDNGFMTWPASGKLLVGYTATDVGEDALRLGIALARGRDVSLEIVMIIPEDNVFGGVYPHQRGYGSILERQLATWLDEAAQMVPPDIHATTRLYPGDSEENGLLSSADELDCDLIIIGGRRGSIFPRFEMGSCANALLHSANRPVVLAPKNYSDEGPIARMTSFFGPQPGANNLVRHSVDRASRRGIPLRLISLYVDSESRTKQRPETVERALKEFAGPVSTTLAMDMIRRGEATAVAATGKTVEDAISGIEWHENDIAVVGSSRLAVKGRLFIGSTTTKILRHIPVPLVVIPSGYVRTYEKGDPDG
ncbi:universal stress protein [Corynebacterium cystitidis]|uniref:Nucleotide-binding universal stress protein, UspA family n=1 Tax=Corynebacterium cystitidis DSM 20524 TaxID=1121357 RepID=A0A1H9QP39_9CORY|nr:universal stress protein [Corynebacterium cystitidis]WJY81708.1 Universal stress protein family protein [Corynebacterium cystitidis DSM 20524]SER62266.1 Nucleotide-binding universal stress protein, UspA family [Corynebacterium cystitidis DSM 20524]SNV84655.1 universal stress protein [Corynebacterium cystitidis]